MSSTTTTTTTQLLDALTSHVALFSPPNPNPNPNPRSAILRWFSTLPSTLRRSHLTLHHPTLLSLLHTITSRSTSSLFLLLPDLPDGPLPSLCFRRPTSLLATVSASETSIGDQILLFESVMDGGVLDCFTVREGFVEDVEGFVEVMDGVSNGGFLRGEVEGLGEEWCELPWLKEKGFYSLDAFLGNWIEVALRRAWLERKGKKGVKLNVLAKNVLERKIGCVDWFLRLDPGVRRRVCVGFLTKGAKLMVTELLKSPDFASMDDFFSCKEPSGGAHCKTRNQLLHGTELDFFLCAIQKKAPEKNPILLRHLKKLVVLQQIGNILIACQNGEINPDSIFFTTLSSVHTIQDHVFRRLRCFLKVIANSSMEFELMMDLSTNTLTKKPDVKSKKFFRKGAKTTKKLSKSPQERSNIHQQQNDPNDTSLCQRQEPTKEIESGISHINPICEESCLVPSSNNSLSSSQREVVAVIANEKVKPDHIVELAEHRTRIPRKRSGRKRVRGKMKVVDKIENPTTGTQGSNCVVSIERKEEYELLNSDSPVPLKSTDDKVKIDISTSGLVNVDDGPKEVLAEFSAPATLRECQNGHTFARFDVDKSSNNKNVSIEKNEGFQNQMKTSASPLSNNSSVDIAQDKTIATSASLESDSYGNRYCCAEETGHKSKSFEVENGCQPEDAVEYCRVLNGSNTVCEQGDNSFHFGTQTTYVGSTSYEWPDLAPRHSLHFRSTNPPAATDRLHLEVGHNLPNHYHHSFLTTRHQVRHAPVEHGHGHTLTSVNFPLSSDLPPLVRNCSRLIQSVTPNIDPWNPRIRSTLCTGSANEGVQFKGAYMENEWLYSGDVVDLSDYQNGSYFFDDTDNHWMSEEELDVPTINGRDYNKYFGGGAMYWNTPEHVGMGSSRAPSHSSEDSSWAWHEADLNRAIDDMVGLPGIPATYGVNGLASPTTPALCSPFETLGHGQQSIGYVYSGNDMNSKSIDSQTSTADIPEDDATPGSLNASTGSIDGMKGDSLPYPMLRPIIIPSISRKGSRSDFKHSRDHRSPCLPSSKKDAPRIKRPPSPVVLCIPRAPRVPPPSPVGDSRKQRGFPVVRSGSSSPRHWGMRSGHHEETRPDDANLCIDGPEVVWTSWGSKGIPRNAMVQAVPGSLLQERLIAISQIGRDQEHPDVAFPVQPPEILKHPTWMTSLTSGCSLLHEEISSFCKQVAAENHSKKPYINWAVKRVARSLQVLWPRSRTNIFGSVATGLALPSSDVDLVVCLPPVRNLEPIKEAGILEGRNGIKETCLQHAARYLANQEWVKNDSLKTIENTAIPLIMIVAEVPIYLASSSGRSSSSHPQERQSTESVGTCGISHSSSFNAENASSVLSSAEVYKEPVRLDISFKSPSHTGLQTTELVRELTEQFPASVPLALILKQFLADRSLDHAYSGGLSSYCLVLLITRFLQHEHHIGRLLNQNLGSLLMDFLYFFGNVFDPRQMRISIRGSGLYMNRERGYSIDPIHIDDPLCATNNVGRNCFRIHQCIKAFADAYSLLESEMVSFSSNQDSQTSSTAKLLEKIIPSIYEKKPS